MTAYAISSKDSLGMFEDWADQKREGLLTENLPKDFISEKSNADFAQGAIFCNDFKHYIRTFLTQSVYEIASIVQCIATFVIAPFVTVTELCRLCNRSISVSTWLRNICTIPKHIIISIFKSVFFVLRDVNNVVEAISTSIGFLAWHSGEKVVRLIRGFNHTVLSNEHRIRGVVYHSIGLTLLAGAAIFVPIASIQMTALPIIVGSIYGTINNQFTVRECPEYYTMGHYYDGTDLKGHAIKTNNVLIKPVVTGCYATIMVTKIAGVVLAAVGTIPYATTTLPVSYAAALIAGVCLVSLVAAHIFSFMKKSMIGWNLNKLATLLGFQWTASDLNKSWNEFAETANQRIKQKQYELRSNKQELEKFNKKLKELLDEIKSNITNPNMPIKLIAKWQANNSRNGVGYLSAGCGTIVLSISTILLRAFPL